MRTLVFDTETTGLLSPRAARISRQPKIIEFYGSIINGETYHSLFNPEEKLENHITRITGLKDADLKDAPLFRDKAKEIVPLIESADIVVAHNVTFDQGIIDINLERAGLGAPNWPRLICTVEATEHLYGRRMKLGDLYLELFNDTFKAHRAKEDVTALVRVFTKLVEDGEIIL